MLTMHSLVVFALIAGLSHHAAAAAVDPIEQYRQTNRVVQVKVGEVLLNGPAALESTYAKYDIPIPSKVAYAAAAAATQSGSVQATPGAFDAYYLCPVTVGKTKMMLNFDTGSSDLWVFSKQLPASIKAGHAIYQEGGTKLQGETWSIMYGDGSGASGTVYADKVVIGEVTATVQAVEAATSISTKLAGNQAQDGLVGFAFDNGNTATPKKALTFMQQVGPTLPKDLFTATLRHAVPGEYDFGFIDPTKYTGAISYVNINTANSYWQFPVGGYAVGTGAKKPHSFSAIADTGTSLILTDNNVIDGYWTNVPTAVYDASQEGIVFKCEETLPPFSVYISGAKRTTPGHNINFGAINSTYCYGGIQSNNGLGFTVLGDAFLKGVYAVFDMSVPRLGIAQQKNPT